MRAIYILLKPAQLFFKWNCTDIFVRCFYFFPTFTTYLHSNIARINVPLHMWHPEAEYRERNV